MGKHYSGSDAPSSMRHGKAEKMGAGELDGPLGGPGPGDQAKMIGRNSPENPVRKTPPESKPKGMKEYSEE